MQSKADDTRTRWRAVLAKHRGTSQGPDHATCWSARHDLASGDELRAIQNEKLAALTPFLYENSGFYRRRFDRLGLTPTDIQRVEDLSKWPVVTKEEMAADAAERPPYGSYLSISQADWLDRGWMQFATSGSSGPPRVFRYTHVDRDLWGWANARALRAMGVTRGDSVLLIGGFGPHVFLWGVYEALTQMQLPVIPSGGLDGAARARIIATYQPTVMACTPSYALHLGGVMREQGHDPAQSSLRTLLLGGEPGISVPATRQRLEQLWNARAVEFYGCTEVSPHCGGFSCSHSAVPGQEPFAHLMEDIQIWETVNAGDLQPTAAGERGLTVCTSLNSESSPQLRFLIGDYTRLDRTPCACGRQHVRAMGSFSGRADDVINLRGIKFMPSQIEECIRRVSGTGNEFEIILSTNPDGLDVMQVRVEHADAAVSTAIAESIRTHCEVRCAVTVLPPNTLPKTEFKARRVKDQRQR